MIKARGSKELKAFREGEKLSLKQSVLAKCCECMCNYADGKIDCKIDSCPLYPYMSYGGVWKGRARKIMSPKCKDSLLAGLKRHKDEAIQNPK